MTESYKVVYVKLTDSQKKMTEEKIARAKPLVLNLSVSQVNEAKEKRKKGKGFTQILLTNRQYLSFMTCKEYGLPIKLEFHLHQLNAIAENSFNSSVNYNPVDLRSRHVLRRADIKYITSANLNPGSKPLTQSDQKIRRLNNKNF